MAQERIPFDIKYRPDIEGGKYLVVTRDGSPVRIVCWDAKAERPILYLVFVRGKEWAYSYPLGSFYHSPEVVESDNDLFLVANPDYVVPAAEPSVSADTFVDWDAFRRKASLQIAAGFAANGNFLERSIGQLSEDIADCAVVTADILIKKLKGE